MTTLARSTSKGAAKKPMMRVNARRLIVEQANRVADANTGRRPYRMRHLQTCVAIVRHHQRVSPQQLELAGFRGTR